MEYMDVKGAGRPVSKIVMGTAGGTPGFSPDDRDVFEAMAERYVEAGGNLFDTARFYGLRGASEVLLADWLKKSKKRDKVFVLSKCCSPYVTSAGVQDDERSRVHPEFISEDLTVSLDKTGFEYFDFYLMHRDDRKLPVGELLDRLEYHRGLGKIRAYGLSNWEKDRIEEAERYCDLKGYAGISLLEPSYSLATVRAPRWPNTVYLSDEEARYFSDKGLPILSFSPLGGGYFAGVFFRDESRVTEGVRRAYFNDENTEKYRRALLLAEKRGSSPENIALAYIMSLDLLVAPVIGPRTVSELLSSLGAANIRLSEAEIEYLSLRSSYV